VVFLPEIPQKSRDGAVSARLGDIKDFQGRLAHELFGMFHAQGNKIFPRSDPHVLFEIPRKIFAVHIKPFGYF
jgi:hypothetical protein